MLHPGILRRHAKVMRSVSACHNRPALIPVGGKLGVTSKASPGISPTEILVSDVDPAVVSLVRQKQVLGETMADTQRLAAKLEQRYESLEERFPEQP